MGVRVGFLSRLLGRTSATGTSPRRARGGVVPDWPSAAVATPNEPHRNDDFCADDASSETIGVLQWTPGLLIDGGGGRGSWDYTELQTWIDGEMADSLVGIGDWDSSAAELEAQLGTMLKRGVRLTPGQWTFTPESDNEEWTAPLFVVDTR